MIASGSKPGSNTMQSFWPAKCAIYVFSSNGIDTMVPTWSCGFGTINIPSAQKPGCLGYLQRFFSRKRRCHSERSEESYTQLRSFALLRMTPADSPAKLLRLLAQAERKLQRP